MNDLSSLARKRERWQLHEYMGREREKRGKEEGKNSGE